MSRAVARRVSMINYTERIALLMDDVCRRTPRLSFIDLKEVLIFGRFGRSHTEGAFATCHCLTLPESEPGYYFWRDRDTGQLTRRSEWFVTKSPEVRIGGTQDQVSDLVRAAALLRSVARALAQSRALSAGRAGLARQARHGRARALSHRSRRGWHPQADPRRRHRLAALARARVLQRGRRDGAGLSRDQSRSGALRVPPARLQHADVAVRRRRRRRRSGTSRRFRSATCRPSRCRSIRTSASSR